MLGPSGSGKTTTLRMIAGFERPDFGALSCSMVATWTGVPPFDRDVNTVFQDYALFPHMTVERQRRLRTHGSAGSPKGTERERRVREVLLDWRASATSAAYVPDSPGGGGQRVALARARLNRPSRPPSRRAAGRPGPQAAAGDADRAQGDPAAGRDHVHLRDPRPGGGADDERPDGGLQPRPDRAGSGPRPRCTSGPRPPFVAGFVGTSNLLTGAVARNRSSATPGTFTVRPEKIRLAEPGASVADDETLRARRRAERRLPRLGHAVSSSRSTTGGELVVTQQNLGNLLDGGPCRSGAAPCGSSGIVATSCRSRAADPDHREPRRTHEDGGTHASTCDHVAVVGRHDQSSWRHAREAQAPVGTARRRRRSARARARSTLGHLDRLRAERGDERRPDYDWVTPFESEDRLQGQDPGRHRLGEHGAADAGAASYDGVSASGDATKRLIAGRPRLADQPRP